MIKLTERQKQPMRIQPWGYAMNSHHPDFANSYIGWHKTLAEAELEALKVKYSLTVHSSFLTGDGWGDGFKCLHAVVETKSEALLKIKWHDGNQSYMKRGRHACGWSILSEGELA
jgi:hypothetical protein